jgi:hypothetical protein
MELWNRSVSVARVALSLCVLGLGCGTSTIDPPGGGGNAPLSIDVATMMSGMHAHIETTGPLRTGMLDFIVHLTDAQGQPISQAAVRIVGIMTAHRHGSTGNSMSQPGSTPGEYRISGAKYDMSGTWAVTVDTDVGGQFDRALFQMNLP